MQLLIELKSNLSQVYFLIFSKFYIKSIFKYRRKYVQFNCNLNLKNGLAPVLESGFPVYILFSMDKGLANNWHISENISVLQVKINPIIKKQKHAPFGFKSLIIIVDILIVKFKISKLNKSFIIKDEFYIVFTAPINGANLALFRIQI